MIDASDSPRVHNAANNKNDRRKAVVVLVLISSRCREEV